MLQNARIYNYCIGERKKALRITFKILNDGKESRSDINILKFLRDFWKSNENTTLTGFCVN